MSLSLKLRLELTLRTSTLSTSAADVQSAVPEKECFGVQNSVGYKRRRLYESRGLLLQPYRKKPKMLSSALYPNDDPKRHIIPPTFRSVRLKDLLWMMSLRFMPQTTPMWVGWNSLLSPSDQQGKRQNVWYLPQINLSPTSYTVVAETLNV